MGAPRPTLTIRAMPRECGGSATGGAIGGARHRPGVPRRPGPNCIMARGGIDRFRTLAGQAFFALAVSRIFGMMSERQAARRVEDPKPVDAPGSRRPMCDRRSWFLVGAYLCVAAAMMLLLSTIFWL
jgi:hypothetical protein